MSSISKECKRSVLTGGRHKWTLTVGSQHIEQGIGGFSFTANTPLTGILTVEYEGTPKGGNATVKYDTVDYTIPTP